MPPSASPFAVTIFEHMSALCRETGAINLGQGFPEGDEPAELIAAAQTALATHSNQYPPMRGLVELRGAIAHYYAESQGLSFDPASEIVVTSGATEALAATILALVQPGDEVICLQPLYDAYLPLIARAGGVARLVDLAPPDWRLPIAALAAAITPRTRLLILNTPNNPTGTLLSRAELEAIGDLCTRHDLIVLSDEVWEAMVLESEPQGVCHFSPLAIDRLRDRTVKIGSAGKIFSMTGWKVGWAVAAPPLAARVAASHQFLTFTTATPLQWAVAEGLGLGASWHASHGAAYAAGKVLLEEGLARVGYVTLPAPATWFSIVDLAASGLISAALPDDVAVAEALIRRAGVGSIAVSAFYAEAPVHHLLRLCHAKPAPVIAAALDRLARFRADAVAQGAAPPR